MSERELDPWAGIIEGWRGVNNKAGTCRRLVCLVTSLEEGFGAQHHILTGSDSPIASLLSTSVQLIDASIPRPSPTNKDLYRR